MVIWKTFSPVVPTKFTNWNRFWFQIKICLECRNIFYRNSHHFTLLYTVDVPNISFSFGWGRLYYMEGREWVIALQTKKKESSHFHYFIKILNFVHKKIIIIVSYGFTKLLNCYESKKTKLKMQSQWKVI